MPGWVPTELAPAQRHRPGPARPGHAAADRLLPRAPGHRRLHPRRRGRRLDPRRRHGRIHPAAHHRPRPTERSTCTTRKRTVMTAPSLVLLGYGSHDPRVSAGQPPDPRRAARDPARARRARRVPRPRCAPSGMPVVNKLVGQGRDRGRVGSAAAVRGVPAPRPRCPTLIAQVRGRPLRAADHRLAAGRPGGPAAVDHRPAAPRCPAGPPGLRAGRAGVRRGRQRRRPQQRAGRPAGPAVVDPPPAALRRRLRRPGPGPSTAEAVRTLRAQGRRHIAVGSWFLAPGLLYTHQAELALRGRRGRRVRPDGRRAGDRRGRADPVRGRGDGPGRRRRADAGPEDFEPAPLRHLSVVSA